MNKKTKRGIILTSLASIAFAGSLLAGSTYALFTSESTTNIAVSSGTVDVVATIKKDSLKTYSGVSVTGNVKTDVISETTVPGTFTTGGTASINKDGDLELVNVAPGDKVTFQIIVENKSTVAVKYHTIIKEEKVENSGLFRGLNFKIGESTNTEITDWETLEVKSNNKVLECEVSLPTDTGNSYQGKNAKISFTVEAIQGNAMVSKYCDTLEEAFGLNSDTFAANTTRTSDLEIDGDNLKEKGINGIYINKWVDGYANFNLTIKNVTFLNGLNLTSIKDGITITLENCTVYACNQSKLEWNGSNSTTNSGDGMCLNLEKQSATNVTYNIFNCKFIGENDETLPIYGNKYKEDGAIADYHKKRGYGIAFDAIAGSDSYLGTIRTATISGCEISGVRGNAIQLHGSTGNITISNTKITSWGVNSGGTYLNDEGKSKDSNASAIRGDKYDSSKRTLILKDVEFGLDEGTVGTTGKERTLLHVEIENYPGSTNGSKKKGIYSYPEES